MTTRLSEHFTLEELTTSPKAIRFGINNKPSANNVERLKLLAAGLEKVRALLGGPIIITSGYRCPALNALVRGSNHSAHMDGDAADFICPSFGEPLEIVRKIASSDIIFDQCIQEGTWVHISFAPMARRMVLTAHSRTDGTMYYTQGV